MLNVACATVAVILLIVAVILLLPIDVLLLADTEQGFRIRFRFLGKVYGGETVPDTPDKPFVRWLKKSLGLLSIGDRRALEEEGERRGRVTALVDLISALISVMDRLCRLLCRCRISRLRVKTVSGGEDAAVEYGAVCAVVYPLVGYFRQNGRLKMRNADLSLHCDYEAASSYDVEVAVRATVVQAAWALLLAMHNHAKERKETANGTP